jgi:hypothetical protein
MRLVARWTPSNRTVSPVRSSAPTGSSWSTKSRASTLRPKRPPRASVPIIRVDPGTRVEYPVHLCFGMVPQEGVQEILPTFEIGEGAEVGFLAHCTFPNAVNLQHIMDATVRIGPGATMRYTEAHYHGPHGGIQVLPTSHVIVEEGGRFENEFNLTHGRVGRMEIRMEVDVAARGVAELTVKAYGMGEDYIRAEETIRLNGPDARGLTKTRVAVRDRAVSEVYTTSGGERPWRARPYGLHRNCPGRGRRPQHSHRRRPQRPGPGHP